MTIPSPHRIKFVPEFSLGHVLQVVLVIIPAIVYLSKLDARVQTTEKNVQTLVVRDDKKAESIALLQKNQAVLSAIMDMHIDKKPPKPN